MTDEPQVDFNEPDDSQLVTIVKDSGLEQSKAKYILTKFQDYFTMADDWTQTTKQIVVTDATQTHLMEMARAARLTMKEKRLDIEKTRKELKEQSLREGKAIDGIANVLKALIVPLEEYYEKQENFVEHQAAAKAKLIEQEIQERMDREFEEEQARKKEQDRLIREENERLKKEALEREESIRQKEYEIEIENRKKIEEQKKKDAIIRFEQEQKIADIQRANQAKFDQERKEKEDAEAKLRAIKQAELKAEADKLKAEEDLKKAGDSEKINMLLMVIGEIRMPDVKSQEACVAVKSTMQLLSQAVKILKLATEKKGVDL